MEQNTLTESEKKCPPGELSAAQKLRRIDRYAGISQESANILLERGRFVRHAKGETIFFEGDECDRFLILYCGVVKIAKTLESGKELILDLLGAGETVGEVALLDDLPLPATATAHSDCELFSVPGSEYLHLLDTHPDLARGAIRDLASRLRSMNRRIKDVSGGNVEYRIAHLFLTLADKLGKSESDDRLFVPLHMSRQEIADMVGTSLETAIRIMSRWSKDGIVETANDGFRLKNLERLQAIGETSL